MRTRISLIIAALLISVNALKAQLDLNTAILHALESNRNIQMSKNSVIMTENLSSPGQAGLLPSLSASGLIDYSNNNIRTQATGSYVTNQTDGFESKRYSAGLNLNYTIFSGFANVNTYKKLKTNIHLANADSKVQIESIILAVAANYYNVIRTEDNYNALLESIGISLRRYELAEAKNEYSGGTRLNLLNVLVDLNKDSVTLQDAKLAMEKAQFSLNKIIGWPLDTQLVLNKDFSDRNNYQYEELKSKMLTQNYELSALKFREEVSMLDYKIAKSSFYPSLNLGSSYSYLRNDVDNSGFDLNEQNGFAVNLSLSIPIYSGGRKRAAVKNAKIRIENSLLQTEELNYQLELELLTAYREYENALEKLKMEQSNVETAELNFELTEEKYKLGQVISTQFREAQLNLILSKNSYNNSAFNAKLAELEIIKLSGILLNQNQ